MIKASTRRLHRGQIVRIEQVSQHTNKTPAGCGFTPCRFLGVHKQRSNNSSAEQARSRESCQVRLLNGRSGRFYARIFGGKIPKKPFVVRCRWQIELGIKRWKSVLGVGETNVQKLGVYGEVLLMTHSSLPCLSEKIVVRLAQRWSDARKFPRHRTFQIEHAKYQGLRLLEDFRYRWSREVQVARGKEKAV